MIVALRYCRLALCVIAVMAGGVCVGDVYVLVYSICEVIRYALFVRVLLLAVVTQ